MSSRMFIGAAMAFVSLVLATSCTHESKKKPRDDSSKVLASLGANSFTTVEFNKGKSDLSTPGLQNLKELARKANKATLSIEQIKILAWSDREYPGKEKKASIHDVLLAGERATAIREYLEDAIRNEKEIQSFNMAKRPNALSEMLGTKDYDLKTALEKSGPSTTRNAEGDLSYSKASKAIIIIDYQDR